MAILWECWNAHNCFVFDDTPVHNLSSLGNRAVAFVQSYRDTHACKMRSPTPHPTLWRPPPVGWVKLNFDGGKEGGIVGDGVGWSRIRTGTCYLVLSTGRRFHRD